MHRVWDTAAACGSGDIRRCVRRVGRTIMITIRETVVIVDDDKTNLMVAKNHLDENEDRYYENHIN